jgi:hypothetical protein
MATSGLKNLQHFSSAGTQKCGHGYDPAYPPQHYQFPAKPERKKSRQIVK